MSALIAPPLGARMEFTTTIVAFARIAMKNSPAANSV